MKVSEFIVDILIEGDVINKEEKKLYTYCFETVLFVAINIITTIIIGFFFREVLATILFMVVFISMRVFAGGYHCKTEMGCYFLSMVVHIFIIGTYRFFSFISNVGGLIVCFFNVFFIILWSPVESKNKPLGVIEKRKNHHLSVILCIFFSTVFVYMMKLSNVYRYVILETQMAIVFFMFIGKINCQIRSHSSRNKDHS